jgi:POT family proton-dependent oligopeptide transporter
MMDLFYGSGVLMFYIDSLRKNFNNLLNFDHKQKQVNTIAMITFWSQFSVYVFNTVLILFLTRPILTHGLGFSEAKAYAFIGVSQATGYLMPMLGGYMADNHLGIRRAILIGSILVATAYLFVMLSGLTISTHGKLFFIMAYALIPVTNSLLLGTASGLVSRIYSNDKIKAKSGMTLYYMSINIGALLATIIAPKLLDSPYGPLSVFAVVFVGKSIAALNYAWRYHLYDDVITTLDQKPLSTDSRQFFIAYLAVIYGITLFAYFNPNVSSYMIAVGCSVGIAWFLLKTLRLQGEERTKQMIAVLLTIEAIVFFVIYNQMNSTLIMCAKNNSNLHLLGLHVSPAHYQMINSLMIVCIGLFLPKFYQRFHNFNIPYQFAAGTTLAGIGLLVMWHASNHAINGIIDGNYIGLTYLFISLAELWVSAIGLSMIGLYCAPKMISFAMGAWYLSSSLSYVLSGQIAKFVALPSQGMSKLDSLAIYQDYYFSIGLVACGLGLFMYVTALVLKKNMDKRGIALS